ncbi:GNAT family N-acetyltransferase [Novosphingobium jiangmenense]|uniref:GNAT family N-acetyltransferase n=1 Tax=Novosphingobium jiangmenense TaxID=2791981 RepID=A0ABS0HBI0_9SPHN|nr:GNAT family protein [Novosphingobium jiangmenense]MBF9149488.1 GNAT family N-acetyltransferase [Novosphingobium jiangmenense]
MPETLSYPRTVSAGPHTIELRLLQPGDADALIAFAQGLPQHDLLFLLRDIRNPRVVAAWIEQVQRGQIRSLVAVEGSEIVGCTALARDELSWSPHVADIRMLVSPRMRGTGFGRVLAQECVAMAMADGVSKLTARLTPDQGAALTVFEDLGFRPEALLRDHVRDTAGELHDIAIMALDLERQGGLKAAYGMG